MREKIHPKFEITGVVCSCGEKFETGSIKQNIRVEICSKCHPFYTGNKARVLDTAGRVEKFNRRFGR